MRYKTKTEVSYLPLDILKPVTDDLWIVDSGPLRLMGLRLPVRMTVIRLSSGEIWLHSPTRFDEGLKREIEGFGPISLQIGGGSQCRSAP